MHIFQEIFHIFSLNSFEGFPLAHVTVIREPSQGLVLSPAAWKSTKTYCESTGSQGFPQESPTEKAGSWVQPWWEALAKRTTPNSFAWHLKPGISWPTSPTSLSATPSPCGSFNKHVLRGLLTSPYALLSAKEAPSLLNGLMEHTLLGASRLSPREHTWQPSPVALPPGLL